MKVDRLQGRRKRGRPKRKCLDKVNDDIKENRLPADEVYDRAVLHGGICHHTPIPHESWNTMKERELHENVWKAKSALCYNRLESYIGLHVCESNSVPILDCEVSTNWILGEF